MTDIERSYIKFGQSARAAWLYRRRTLSLAASLIASPTLRRREYVQVKLGLLEIYKLISSRGRDLEWLERAYLALGELAGLVEEGSEPGVLLRLVDEIKRELEA